jgi:hypothetical protein
MLRCTKPSPPRHRDGQPRLRDGIHRRGHQRNIQRNFLRDVCLRIDFCGKHRGFSRQQQHIVKRQTFDYRSFHSHLLATIKKWPLKTTQPSGRPLGKKGVASKWRAIIVEKSFYARRHPKSSAPPRSSATAAVIRVYT